MSVRVKWVCPECGAYGEAISEGKIDAQLTCTRCGVPIVERVFETGDFKKFASEFHIIPTDESAPLRWKCAKCGTEGSATLSQLADRRCHCLSCNKILSPMDVIGVDEDLDSIKKEDLKIMPGVTDAASEAPKPAAESGGNSGVLSKKEVAEFVATLDAASPIFAEAVRTINGPRVEDYGDANESFARIAALWSAYLNTPVSSADVAMMMSLLKMVRLKHSKFAHHDSFVDLLGYVGLAHKVSGEK